MQTIYHLDQVYDLKLSLQIQKMDVLFDKDRYIYDRVQSIKLGRKSKGDENPASKYAFCNNLFLRATRDKLWYWCRQIHLFVSCELEIEAHAHLDHDHFKSNIITKKQRHM